MLNTRCRVLDLVKNCSTEGGRGVARWGSRSSHVEEDLRRSSNCYIICTKEQDKTTPACVGIGRTAAEHFSPT